MALTSEHQTHIHQLFYALCKERGWALGLPTCFDYGYLNADVKCVQARITLGEGKPLILFHPAAFGRGRLVKGLLHHELCHYLLGPEVGHGPRFLTLEEGWDWYYAFKQESADFARWLLRQRPEYRLTCLACGTVMLRNTVPVGRIACRACCEKHANGEYDERYNLHIGGEGWLKS
jgi:hypothetical protein